MPIQHAPSHLTPLEGLSALSLKGAKYDHWVNSQDNFSLSSLLLVAPMSLQSSAPVLTRSCHIAQFLHTPVALCVSDTQQRHQCIR